MTFNSYTTGTDSTTEGTSHPLYYFYGKRILGHLNSCHTTGDGLISEILGLLKWMPAVQLCGVFHEGKGLEDCYGASGAQCDKAYYDFVFKNPKELNLGIPNAVKTGPKQPRIQPQLR